MRTKLQRAASARSTGRGVSATKALRSAKRRIQSMSKRTQQAKVAAKEMIGDALETGETFTTFAVSEYAEARYGKEKLVIADKFDGRALGVATFVGGMAMEMFGSGTTKKAGKHVSALSEGVVLSYLGSKVRHAGEKARAKAGTKVADTAPPALEDREGSRAADTTSAPAASPLLPDHGTDSAVAELLRQIQLTPGGGKAPREAAASPKNLTRAKRLPSGARKG